MSATSDRRRIAARARCWFLAVLLGVAATWIPATAAAATAKLAPDRHGVIHACYGSSDWDELHVVAESARCPQGYAPLSWNQRGRRGPSDSDDASVENWNFTFSAPAKGGSTVHSPDDSLWSWIGEAVPALGNALLFFGLGMLALSIALVPLGWLLAVPYRWPGLWRTPIFRSFGPALQIQPFEASALQPPELGTIFALLTQTRVGGGREGGQHLYLVTGEGSPGPALAELQTTPQTQPLAAALSLLKLTWGRRRLLVTGSLTRADDHGTAAVALTLRRNSKFIGNAEFWPLEKPSPEMTPITSNRVLAVAAAGWIEHRVVDETPGPQAREIFLSHDPRSWALFRAGAELSRISFLKEAADHYERALAIDGENIGALVDLAHLRRMEGYFEGAEALAYSAIDLIEERPHRLKRLAWFEPIRWLVERIHWFEVRAEDDPIWYRAQIVLTTVHAEWAKELESEIEASIRPHTASTSEWAEKSEVEAERRHHEASARGIEAARAAMDTRDRLETLIGKDRLKAAAEGATISRAFRASRVFLAWRKRRRLRFEDAVGLYSLLCTTFEPGALLLVAANAKEPAEAPTAESDYGIRYSVDNGERDPLTHRADLARQEAKAALDQPTPLDPRALIKYIRTSRLKSPRVVYNLACYYTLAVVDTEPGYKKEYMEIAAEYLRQSISRSAPRERRGLLEHAEKDKDLVVLRQAFPSLINKLWQLIPGHDAPPNAQSRRL